MFKNRIAVIAVFLALFFSVVLLRLWQLQVSRYEKYNALARRDVETERMVPAKRGDIYDRNGEALAYDEPFFDVSVRVERLKFASVTLDDVRDIRERYSDPKDIEFYFAQIEARLIQEPYVRNLAQTLKRDESEIANGIRKALDRVARKWDSPRRPLKIVGGIDEKTWLALRTAHEDVFRDSVRLFGKERTTPPFQGGENDWREPPFPGLVCTISTHRVYPHGHLGCFVLGTVGELGAAEEQALREDGILIEQPVFRRQRWNELREGLPESAAVKLEPLLGGDPRDMHDLWQIYTSLAKLRPCDRKTAAALGLAEPVRWTERPARMTLCEPEMLWLGVGFPINATKNRLPSSIVGEMGVERWRNDLLRGKAGMMLRGEQLGDDELAYRSNSRPREGSPIALTISTEWQGAVEKALRGQEHPGAIVVLDVHTGDVLAMASNPDFDPNLFSPPHDGKERQEKLNDLMSDPLKPLTNRAIQEQYPLGSVMKSLIAAVALERGLVSTTETFECKGFIVEGGQKFHCDDARAHGTVNLFKAIRCSCNVAFMQIGARIGVENLGPYARLILGRRTNIDIPGEAAGIYPDREWRLKHFPSDPGSRLWTRGQDYLLSIGQGQMACTVTQAAVLMAAIANGGTVVSPHVWLDAPAGQGQSLGISAGNLAIVREGLEEVVNVGTPGERGTAYNPFHEQGQLSIRVAGKTSTAEHGHGKTPHAWFAGYAPADNPQIAFAVLIEEGGHGGAAAAPVAYQFLREIYGTKNSPKGPVAMATERP
jgi:cell division protein FtsI/penicillin-binding protein 2